MPSNGWTSRFRTQLNDVMQRRRLGSKELAKALHVHANTIARWRNAGNARGISVDSLVDLSKLLAMPPAVWFLKSAATPAIEDELRRVLDYVEHLDEAELGHFLGLVGRIIDFAEDRSSRVKGVTRE